MKKKWIISVMSGLVLCLWQTQAEAARDFTITQINPTAPAEVVMGTTVPFTFRITNTNTGGNTGERIYEMRFRIESGTTFSAATAAPAGWTRTSYSTTSVTFRANSWANAIVTGNSLDFVLMLLIQTTTADVATERLRDARARYTTTTSGPPFSRLGSDTVNNPGSWTVKSLQASFQITDLSGNPITAIQSGGSFRLIMTVTNRSSSSKSSIVTSPNPPTVIKTGTVTQTLTSTAYNPNPLTLAVGATGTITFTYSTAATDNGTISFRAFARNSAGSGTSPTITSIILAVSRFSASITVTPTCAYAGQDITVAMLLTNSFPGPPPGNNINGVTPTLNPSVGAPVALQSGPAPAAPNGPVPSGGGTLSFSWVYRIAAAATPGQTFTFSGLANATSGPSLATPNTTSGLVTVGGYTINITPDETNASSTNQVVSWSFINQGCAAVNSVSVSYPAGWSYGGDSYSLVENTPGNLIETWTASGTNPVVFTAPSATERLMLGGTGDFRLVFTATPVATGASSFTLITTDANGQADTDVVPIMVNTFNFNSLNEANTESYREEFR